jgi:LysR family glycine cleavage system transcriptional activator
MSRLPPLNAVRAFVAAANLKSFKDAADELSVTPGAISRQIQTLEKFFGIALFERGYRAVKLTPAGERYFTRVAVLFAQLRDAGNELIATGRQPLVRIDCTPTFAMHWLLPRLPLFQAAHPEIEVALTTSLGPVDRHSDFDFSIRRDPAHFSSLHATRLVHEYSAPVCGPAFKGLSRLRQPPDLARFKVIYIRVREDLWPTWTRAVGLDEQKLRNRLTLDQTFFAIQAAEEGLGVAVVPLLFVQKQIKSGRLVTPLRSRPVISGTYHLLARTKRPTAPAHAFSRWLTEAARQRPA